MNLTGRDRRNELRLREPVGIAMKFVFVLMVALLAGCSSRYSAGDLVGKYVLSVDGGIDTIELSANGTYSHTYTAKGGKLDHHEDTWNLEELQAGTTVVLNNFHLLFKEDVGGRGSYQLLLVKRSFGTLPDQQHRFERRLQEAAIVVSRSRPARHAIRFVGDVSVQCRLSALRSAKDPDLWKWVDPAENIHARL
jgi:hypothetical protein